MPSPSDLIAAADAVGLRGLSLVLIDLDTGRTTVAGASPEMYPASMIKTPLAVAVAVAERAGRLRWTESLAVGPENLTVNDAPSPLLPAANATIAELVELMLSRSDNVATNMLVDRVGRARATADLAALGLRRTAIRRKVSGALPLVDDPAATGRNTHPADEAAALFARLATGDLPGSDRIRAALDRQYWNAKLSAGLDPADRFAHKTGDTDEVSHDGGILTLRDGRRFALAAYTPLPSNETTDLAFAEFMRSIRPGL